MPDEGDTQASVRQAQQVGDGAEPQTPAPSAAPTPGTSTNTRLFGVSAVDRGDPGSAGGARPRSPPPRPSLVLRAVRAPRLVGDFNAASSRTKSTGHSAAIRPARDARVARAGGGTPPRRDAERGATRYPRQVRTVRCWGEGNFEGELGNPTFSATNTPVDVIGLTGAISVPAATNTPGYC